MNVKTLAEKLKSTGTGRRKIALVEKSADAESAIAALTAAGFVATAAKARKIVGPAPEAAPVPEQPATPPSAPVPPPPPPAPPTANDGATPLPEDFPAREALMGAGLDTLEKVAAEADLTRINGIGQATAGQIAEALASIAPST